MPAEHDQRVTGHKRGPGLPLAIAVIAAMMLLVASVVTTLGVKRAGHEAIDQEVRNNLARLASMTASSIDADAHSQLTHADQEQTPLYHQLNTPLTRAIKRTEGIRYIYTLRKIGDELHFVLDGTPIGDSDNDGVEDHAYLMEVYEDPDPAAVRAIKDRRTTITEEPYTDIWGTFLSGFAPIRREDGTVDGVVGVDLSVDLYQARLAKVDNAAAWALVPGVLLSVLVGLGVWWVARRFVSYTDQIEEHREVAVRANNAKSALLANISHELRTPMNAILGFVNIAGDERTSDMERADAMNTIRYNAEHLMTLINDLLDISKAEAGVIAIEPTEIDLPELIERAVAPLRLRAQKKRIGFHVRGLDELPERVVLDRTRVRQVLLNLLSNAVKFTDDGSVTLEVSAVDGLLEMRVTDTGPGMTDDEVGRLFTPFTQVGSREKRELGTGLGLAISKHLMELMEGSVEVESEPGVGSVFTATVPYGAVDRSEESALQTDTRADWEILDGATIAIAEDGPDNTRLLKMILRRAGAQTHEFGDGEQARAAVLESPDRFDLLITDWDMPVLSGEGLVRKLREAGWTGPIISLTAHALPEQERQCLKVGCDAHMTKPLQAKALIETCAGLIKQHGPRRRAA